MAQIYELIPKIMAEVGAIHKGRKNQQQGYAFRGIDDVYLAMQGPLAQHGVFYVPKVLDSVREERQTKSGGTLIYTTLKMQFTFYAPDGSNVETVTVGEAMDSGDKSSNKAMSAALKYALLQVFCIPTEEDNDTENASPEPTPRQTPPPAKPTTSAVKIGEAEAFQVKVREAFDARGFTDEQWRAANVYICTAKKITSVDKLGESARAGLMTAIADGKFDKYKTAKAA